MQFVTESGTRYEVRYAGGGKEIRRIPTLHNSKPGMRQDTVWLKFTFGRPVVVGQPLTIFLEPLDPAAMMTIRTTTPVKEVVWDV